MLESSSLSIGPWSAAASSSSVQRAIHDSTTGQLLGLARWLEPPAASWRRWFRLPVLEVLESDDESLLCTLRRSWRPLPWWDVLDADGRIIGSLRHGAALDPLGRRFAVLRPLANGAAARFLDGQGLEVGTLTPIAKGLQLSFAASLQENPFAKMILLAAALIA